MTFCRVVACRNVNKSWQAQLCSQVYEYLCTHETLTLKTHIQENSTQETFIHGSSMYENDIRGISSFENFYIIGTSTYENNIQRTSKHVTVFLCTILLLLKLQSIETILFFTVYKAH